MPERSPMSAVGDTITMPLTRQFNGTVTFSLPAGAAPVGVVAIAEITADDINWEQASLTRPDKTIVTQLTGVGQSGWCEAPGYTQARLRLTGLTSGQINGRVEPREG